MQRLGLRDRLQTLGNVTGHPLNAASPRAAALRYFGWNIGRRLFQAEYVLPLLNDTQIIVSNEENYSTLAYTMQLWDFEEMLFVAHFLRPEDTFADVGANVGGYTLIAAGVAKARCVSFEPVPSTYAKLLRNIRLNRLEDKVDALMMGVADADGHLTFTATLGGLNHVGGAEGNGIRAEVCRLDKALASRLPAMLKMDIEGFELSALKGAVEILASSQLRALCVELNGSGRRYGVSDNEVHDLIVQAGFRPYRSDPGKRKLTEQESYSRSGLNTLYCREIDFVTKRLIEAPALSVRGLVF